MKSEGWASFSCDQGRAGPPCTPLWCSLGDTSGGGPTIHYAVLSQLRHGPVPCWPHNNMSPSVSQHNHAVSDTFHHAALQQSACSSLSCSAILHFSSVRYKVKCSEQWLLVQLYICQTITCHQQCNDDAVVDCLPAGVCHYQLMARCTWDPGQASQGLRCPQL